MPRLETPKDPRARSLGPVAVEWINASGILGRGNQLLPWQVYLLTRALELRQGRLRFEAATTTVARQNGKSWGVRALAWWRMHQAERFGEDQLLLHMAQKIDTAIEVWQPAAFHAIDMYGKQAVKWGRGTEEIILPDRSGRWKLQAASVRSAIGFSVSSAIVDEAFLVEADVVNSSLAPTMLERRQPQLHLISTAGDASSTLLNQYRARGLQDEHGSSLTLDWSPPPDAAIDDPNTWRWASPNWSPRREVFLRNQLELVGEHVFRRQFLNIATDSSDGWIPAATWARGASQEAPVGRPDVVAVEAAEDHSRFGGVAVWNLPDGGLWAVGFTSLSRTAMWDQVGVWQGSRLLLGASLLRLWDRRQRPEAVTAADHAKWMGPVTRLLQSGGVRHSPTDAALGDDVAAAVAVSTETGLRLSRRHSTGPHECARALVFAAGAALEPPPARPVVRAG